MVHYGSDDAGTGEMADESADDLLDELKRLEPIMTAANKFELPRLFTLAESRAKKVSDAGSAASGACHRHRHQRH
jgi:hypothetical protein